MPRRRRNDVAEFFQGFNAGFDTVGKVTEAFQLGDIANSTPTDFQQFTTEQAAELESLAKTPGIDITTNDAGGYRVKNVETGETRDVVPGATRSLFRNRFLDSPPTETEQTAIRTNDMADVIARRDPVRAQSMRHTALANRQTEQDFSDQAAIRAAFRQDAPPGLSRIGNPAPRGATEGMDASAVAGPAGLGLEKIPMTAAGTGDSQASATAMPSPPTGATEPTSIPIAGTAQQPDFGPGDRAQIVAANAALERGAMRETREGADAYYRRKSPQIIDAYMKQGNVKGASDFRNFIDSEEGRTYTHAWSKGVRQLTAGDHLGAIKTFEAMYNRQDFPDGHTVKLTPLEGGSSYRADFMDSNGQTVNSVTKPTSEFVRQAGMALAPEKMAEFLAWQNAKRDSEVAGLDKGIQLENLRQDGRDLQEDRRDKRLQQRLDAQDRMLSRRLDAAADRGLTATQQRTNDAIDAARTQLTGMSQPDVLRRTQSTTATGRTNPDYDPGLARAAKLATSRKFGDDPEHDAFSAGRAQPPAQGGAGVQQKFAADPSMRGMRLGKQTANGVEVFDSGGKHVGFYR